MSHTLIQIGNSKALIIPARIVKRRKYDSKTEFDIIETAEGLRIVSKPQTLESLEFPKAQKPEISSKIRTLRNTVQLSADELEQDDRLKYILSR